MNELNTEQNNPQRENNDSVVMPTQNDLMASEKYKIPLYTPSPWAVYVKKVSSNDRNTQLSDEQIKLMRTQIAELTKKHKKTMLLDTQTGMNTTLTQEELNIIRDAQDIPELPLVTMPELNHKQSAAAFQKQLTSWMKKYPTKDIVPVLEPYCEAFEDKAAIIKKLGLTRIAVKFRSYGRYEPEFKKAMGTTDALGLYRFVFGVSPTKWPNSGATMLLPALEAKAQAVSRWIAWGGRAMPPSLLDNQWLYQPAAHAGPGLTDYDGKQRTSFVTNNGAINSAFEKIDTINQVSELLRTGALAEIRLERLFN